MKSSDARSPEFGPRTLAQLAHDVRSPTSALSAYLELARGEEAMDEGILRDLSPGAMRGIARLLLLADQLSALSDVMDAPGTITPTATDPASLVRAVLKSASRVLAHAPVEVNVDRDLPLIELDFKSTVPCIAALVGRVWGEAGTTIAFRAEQGGPGVALIIAPNAADDVVDAWSRVTLEDETDLREKIAAAVLGAQGTTLMRRSIEGRLTGYRVVFRASEEDSESA